MRTLSEDEKVEQPPEPEEPEQEAPEEPEPEEPEETPPIDEDIQPFLEEDTEDYEDDEDDYDDEEEEVEGEDEEPELTEAPAEIEPPAPVVKEEPVFMGGPVKTEEPPTTPLPLAEDPRRAKLQTLCERTIHDPAARSACMVTIDEELAQNKDIQSILKVIAEKYADHINVTPPLDDMKGEPDDDEEYEDEEDAPIPFDEEDAHWRDQEFVRPSDFVAAKVPELPKVPPTPTMPILDIAPPKKTEESTPPSEKPSDSQ